MNRVATQASILEVLDLYVEYQTRTGAVKALQGASLDVERGLTYGLVGESGSGKSSLARIAMGLGGPTSRIIRGHIRVAGRDMTHADQREWNEIRGTEVAMVFQDPLSSLNPVMRVGTQIREMMLMHKLADASMVRVRELLEQVQLPAATASAYPHELSGGMRQRALIAMAISCNPRLLIADEPTTALDVTTQAGILRLLRRLSEGLGMAVLLITHDLGLVANFCDRVSVMYAGQTIEHGPVERIISRPAHPYTYGLVRAAETEKDEDGLYLTIPGDVPSLGDSFLGCPFAGRCQYARTRCVTDRPPKYVVDAGTGHEAFCWLLAGS